MPKTSSSLPEGIEDHTRFQQRVWRAQRWAWLGFAAILVAALFGALGRGGLLSQQELKLAGGSLELPIITRWNAPDELRVFFSPSASERRLVVDPHFLTIFSVEGIDPPQKAADYENGRIGYVFPADPGATSQVILRLHTQKPGLHSFHIGIDQDVIEPSVLILP
jgi:protein-L-isoaspartate(D-aspartate) O-methyltransferase